jgi:hypothetical protein
MRFARLFSKLGDAVIAIEGWYYARRDRARRNRDERYFWV